MKDCIAFATCDDFEKKRLLNLSIFNEFCLSLVNSVNLLFFVSIMSVYTETSMIVQPIRRRIITRFNIECSNETIWNIFLKFKLK